MTPRTITSAGYLTASTLAIVGAPLLSSDTPAIGVALYVAALLVFLAALTRSQRSHDVVDPLMRRMTTQLDAMGAELEAERLWRRDLRRAQLVADVLRMRELARAEREHVPSVSGVRSVVRTASEVHSATLPGRPANRVAK